MKYTVTFHGDFERALKAASGPTIAIAQAGQINTGVSDPFAAIAPMSREAGAWLHVDGAFGLWAAASPALRHLIAGADRADSWATDAHKWLNVPYDSGLAFVRDAEALRAAIAVTADYLPVASGVRNPSDFTPELFDRVIALNLKSAWFIAQAVAPGMIERASGVIVNVSSISARNGGGIGAAIYLVEYGRGRLADTIRFFNDVLIGVPTIVTGAFIYAIWVTRFGFSGFAGSLALAIVMLPLETRTT